MYRCTDVDVRYSETLTDVREVLHAACSGGRCTDVDVRYSETLTDVREVLRAACSGGRCTDEQVNRCRLRHSPTCARYSARRAVAADVQMNRCTDVDVRYSETLTDVREVLRAACSGGRCTDEQVYRCRREVQ
ncbi:unnamed protein product [Euphydryas editha]|uniref:Uncharacterized protein n=1 Tax=Euphydryas editha TaxID=104508 RepID=A0AAU9UKS6_EUPED|nr:unnamed protein product [Euphydryas editha]